MKLLDRRLLAYARDSRAYVALAIAAGAAGAVLLVVQATLLARVVARVFEAGAKLEDVLPDLAGLVAAAAGRAALLWVGEVTAQAAASRATRSLRDRLLARALALGPVYLSGERSGELVATATRGTEALETAFAQYLPQLALAALVPLAVLGWIARLDLPSAGIVAATVPLVPIFMVLIGLEARRRAATQWQSLAGLSAHFLDVLQGLPTLRVFGRARAQADILRRVAEQYRNATMGTLRVAFLSALVLEMVATLSTALVAVAIGLRLLDGELHLEEALAVLVLTPEVYLPLRQLGVRFHASAQGAAAAERVFEVLDEPAATLPAPRARSSGGQRISALAFDRVSFAYPRRSEPALRDVSFRLEAGERVAIVGPNGSGKSTLLALLLRFANASSGRILVDGRNLAEIDADEWRRRAAWVPQRPYLFRGSVAENVRLGRDDASESDVVEALRQASALDFVLALPRALDAPVGERGASLSAGQRQRIALARAFLRDAELLLLDEPTANVDAESEAAIAEALARLTRGRTALLVAHDPALVRGADRVIALHGGRVVPARPLSVETFRAGAAPVLPLFADRTSNEHAPPRGISPAASDGRSTPERRPEVEAIPGRPGSDLVAVPPSTGDDCFAPTVDQRGMADSWTALRRLAGLASPHWFRVGLSILLGFLAVASTVGLMATAAFLIARASQRPSIADLSLAVVGVRFFGIARGVFRYLERLASHSLTLRLLADLRVWAYTRIEPLSPAGLDGFRDGDLLARVVSDVDALQDFFARVLVPPAVALLVAVVVGALFWVALPSAAIALLAALLAAGVAVPWLAARLGQASGRALSAARAEMAASLVETLQGAPDLIAFGRLAEHLACLRALGADLGRAEVRAAAQSGLADAAHVVCGGLGLAAVLAAGTVAVAAGELDGVLLGVLALAALASFEAVQPLPAAFQRLGHLARAATRLFALADAVPPTRDPAQPRELAPGPHTVALARVSLRYAADRPWAVEDVDLRLEPGRRVAIVGPSGAGKTTLANLLLRFRDPDRGRAVLDGHDLREYAQGDARRAVGLVDQEAHLFNVSVLDNARLARPGASDAEIEAALRKARLWDWVQSLPSGWHTVVGERGALVSGGQRRRLALARALVADFPILVLDEPTASLDPETADAFLADLLSATTGRSTVLITHRLEGLEAADEILVMDAGRVVERGTLGDLVTAGGRFARLWAAAHSADAASRAPERRPGPVSYAMSAAVRSA